MVRQQEKGPHRRLDDIRREEDRRLAEREQVTNHEKRRSTISQLWRGVGVAYSAGYCKPLWLCNVSELVAMAAGI